MYCKHCGKQVNDTDRFCLFCGGAVTPAQQEQKSEALFIPPRASAPQNPSASFYAPSTDSYEKQGDSFEPYVQPQKNEAPAQSQQANERAGRLLALGIVSVSLNALLYFYLQALSLVTDDQFLFIITLFAFLFPLAGLIVGSVAKRSANAFKKDFGRLPAKARVGHILGGVGQALGILCVSITGLMLFIFASFL